MKISPIHELLDFSPFKSIFLGDKAIVHVKMPYGKIEKHAYPLNEDNNLLIYRTDTPSPTDNPKVKGAFVYDENNRPLFKWQYGEDFAYPLTSDNDMRELISSKERARRQFWRGYELGAYSASGAPKKAFWEDPLMVAIGIVIIAVVANLAITYFGFDALGVGLAQGAAPTGG